MYFYIVIQKIVWITPYCDNDGSKSIKITFFLLFFHPAKTRNTIKLMIKISQYLLNLGKFVRVRKVIELGVKVYDFGHDLLDYDHDHKQIGNCL